MASTALYDFNPVLLLALTGLLLGGVPLAWIWWRHRHAPPAVRLRALTFLTLFLTFDLILFGAFTRLTDSGLGCPDWPGCYGHASPMGAHASIQAAQAAMPSGPVTHGKAWVEMGHRYFATAVGVLILGLAVASWHAKLRGRVAISPWWPTATLAAVCLQGAFGAMTVTMGLYPAVVTAHLLGGMGLLMMLAVQSQGYTRTPLPLSRRMRAGVWAVWLLAIGQVTLGGWVSTNYAVLACTDFPTCQGEWWPPMDFGQGFSVLRPLGFGTEGGYLPFPALTAIHVAHRIGALVLLSGLLALVGALCAGGAPGSRRFAAALAAVGIWQLASGLGNVVLGWPLIAALAHTAGAAGILTLLVVMLSRSRGAGQGT